MNYGEFSQNGKEYIITNPKTPSPWINYIYNGRYFSTISNNGGGISYYKSPLHGRITRYRINEVPPDRPGNIFILKIGKRVKFGVLPGSQLENPQKLILLLMVLDTPGPRLR